MLGKEREHTGTVSKIAMAREIERKFLVTHDGWREAATSARRLEQFYLFVADDRTCRARIAEGREARLTLKTGSGMNRGEFEYDIPLADAEALRDSAVGHIIEKTRHVVPNGPHEIEVDVYEGDLQGLVVAEIELGSEDESYDRPDFLGREVTSDTRYLNANLALHGRPDDDGNA